MAHFANRGILIFIGVGLLLALWNRTKDYSLEYDTVPYFFPEVPSPVLTGTPLKLFIWALETKPFSYLLLFNLRKDTGFHLIEQLASSFPFDLPPAWDPFLPPSPEQTKHSNKEGLSDLKSIGERYQTYKEMTNSPRSHFPLSSFRFWSVSDYHYAYKNGLTTPSVVARAFLALIEESEALTPRMAIFAHKPSTEEVLRQAKESTLRWMEKKPLSLLDGVIVPIKCEFDVKGFVSSGGSPILAREAEKDGHIAEKLKEAGAIVIGGLNMHEFGGGATGINKWYGAPRNPYNVHHMSGGSSSGAGVIVGSGLVPVAIGSDGGGSIRIPSSLCGLAGIKPTAGRVDGRGELPICPANGVAGPLAAHIEDAALVYSIIGQPTEATELSRFKQPLPLLDSMKSVPNVKNLKIGVFRDWFNDCDEDVKKSCNDALSLLESLGAQIVDITIPHLRVMGNSHVMSFFTENHIRPKVMSNLSAVGLDYRVLIALGRDTTADEITALNRVRRFAMNHFQELFKSVDVIATPATASVAPPLTDDMLGGLLDLATVTKLIRYSGLENFVGVPAIVSPVGYSKNHLPIGFQLIAPHWEEDRLIQATAALQRERREREGERAREKPSVFFDPLSSAIEEFGQNLKSVKKERM